MDYKKIKKEAKKNIKNNYFRNVIVVFICTILISGGFNYTTKNILDVDVSKTENIELLNSYDNKTNSEVLDELLEKTLEDKDYEKQISNKFTHGVLSILVNEIATTKSVLFSLLNGINKFLGGSISVAIIIIIANLILFIFKTFFLSVLEIGRNRYFLEQRRYIKTNIDRCLYPYKKRKNFRLSIILLVRNIYLFLWFFTIIGWIVKYYEYKLIPYVLAENPNIKKKEAFRLSKELMSKNKFELFKLDLSLLGFRCLGFLTFNLSNIFYTNIYKETLYSEFYMTIRNIKYNSLTDKKLLNDKLLNISEIKNEEYPISDKKNSIFNTNINKKYSLNSYILFFFTFSFIGWIWEVMLHFVNEGAFVNRGTMYGPWLPIYGFGGISIIFLLKKFRKNPFSMFIASFILCGILEYTTAYFLETFKHLKYWDYSGYFLNIHGRICLEGLILFGLGGCGFTYLFAPLLDNLYCKINIQIKNIICIILLVIFSVDVFFSTFIKPNTGEGITTTINNLKITSIIRGVEI